MTEQHPGAAATQLPISLALIGAGIFMRDAHLPSLLELRDVFNVAALYSRTREAAAALAARLPEPVDLYTDLDALLARPDIAAVDIALPIQVQADVLHRALAAGKHVLSEKPIAPDHARAQTLMQLHATQPGQVWMVGENLRYESVYPTAAKLLRDGAIGPVRLCAWSVFAPMDARSKYYGTGWRRAGDFPGGLVLDGGVHHMAVLRLLMGEISHVAAMTQQLAPDLPPLDTMTATLRFAGDAQGVYTVSYALDGRAPQPIVMTGDDGVMLVHRDQIHIRRAGGEESIPCSKFDGVENEMRAWAAAIRTGAAHRNTPAAALQDLRVVEALLASARTQQTVAVPLPAVADAGE